MNHKELPLVSVVIPTYNRIHTLPASVDSVLGQTYASLELIIMDDGSDDGTDAYVRSITDTRVRYRKADKNMGPSAARNMGAELAKGAYLAFQDSDDEWMPDKLEKQMQLMLEYKDTDLVYSEFGAYREGRLLGVVPPRSIPYEKKQGDLFSYLLLEPLIGMPTVVVKTKEFVKEGGFNETLRTFEDFEFFLRFSQNHKIGFVEEPLVRVNSSPDGVNNRYGDRIRTQFYMIKEMLEPLRERKLLERKLDIVFHAAESLLCHDVFTEELRALSEQLFSEEEKESAAGLLEEMERKKAACRKEEMQNVILQCRQRVLQIYAELYESRILWSGEIRKTLGGLVSSMALFESAFAIPKEARERRLSIQHTLETENTTRMDGLYLLADMVELFEALEKL